MQENIFSENDTFITKTIIVKLPIFQGLKDPWIRNEVWRYDMRDRIVTNEYKAFSILLRGVLPGLMLAIPSAFLWWEYDRRYLSHHGHGDDHH